VAETEPTVPARLTAPAEGPGASWAGRAAALIDGMDRYFAVAADDRPARELPEIAERCTFLAEALLSPDGTRVAVSGEADLLVLDLTTGERHSYLEGPVDALAWAPDGRRLACLLDEELAVVDLTTGEATLVDLDGEECGAAAFSPDGTKLAVDGSDGVGLVIFGDHGDVQDLVSLPTESGEELSGAAAWSPDGRLLTVELATPVGDDLEKYAVSFLDVAVDPPVRSAHRFEVGAVELLDVAGWRSPGELMLVEHRPGGIAVVRRDLTGVELAVLAVGDEDVLDVQLATGLLPKLNSRP
jgi:hypothetical protein